MVAGAAGLASAFLAAAVVMAAGAATLRLWPFQPMATPGAATATDPHYHDDAAALSDPPPQTDHYLAADVRE